MWNAPGTEPTLEEALAWLEAHARQLAWESLLAGASC